MCTHNEYVRPQSGNLHHSFMYNLDCYETSHLRAFTCTYWKIVILNWEWVQDAAIKYFTRNKKQLCVVPVSCGRQGGNRVLTPRQKMQSRHLLGLQKHGRKCSKSVIVLIDAIRNVKKRLKFKILKLRSLIIFQGILFLNMLFCPGYKEDYTFVFPQFIN